MGVDERWNVKARDSFPERDQCQRVQVVPVYMGQQLDTNKP